MVDEVSVMLQRPDPKRKGWFIIPGVQPIGDRTIEQQMKGLEPALAECRGKTVIDLGCAEGAISIAFAKAGAASVLGLETNREGLIVANWIAQGIPNVRFQQVHLRYWAEQHRKPEQYDIVLALTIIHKFHDPALGAHFAAKSSRDLICYRAASKTWDGTIRSKHRPDNTCNWFEIMKEHGFEQEKLVPYTADEDVAYWRRVGPDRA